MPPDPDVPPPSATASANSPAPGEAFVPLSPATPEEAGARLDVWLAARVPDLSRSRAAAAIRDGRVLVGGSPRSANHRVRAGETISWRPAPPSAHAGVEVAAEPIPLSIAYEDEHLLVVDKPAGLVVHPAPGHAGGTLVNALLHHCGPGIAEVGGIAGFGGPARCGLVHRLDALTSGLLIVAKTEAAHARLLEDIATRRVRRRYLALAIGDFKEAEGDIDRPIGRRPGERKLMGVVERGRPSRTGFKVLLDERGVALVLLRLHTGRTHQIRVHLQSIGRPVLGDSEYGWTRQRAMAHMEKSLASGFGDRWPARQMLHAAALRFDHPVTGETVELISPLPEDFASALDHVFGADRRGVDLEAALRADLEISTAVEADAAADPSEGEGESDEGLADGEGSDIDAEDED